MKARSTVAVDGILNELPVVPESDFRWTSNKERHGSWRDGFLHWVPVGRNRGNAGNIKLAGEPFNPIAERAVNGMEALIQLMRLLELLDSPNSSPPRSPREAVERYFGLPKLDLIERMPEAERRALRNRVTEVQKNLKIYLDQDSETSQFAVTIRDNGIGQAPNKISETLLSLTQSDKADQPHLIGLFGQGGSSAYAASKCSVIISRRAPDIRTLDEDDGIGWTIVRHVFPKGRRDTYFAYLAAADDGAVPKFNAEIADAVNFGHGSHFSHIGYDFGGAKSEVSRQMYQTLNHILFNPVMPYELYAMKDKSDSMRGTAQRLAAKARDLAGKGALDKSYPDVCVTAI